jgi:Protein of unknown function (DUF998)
MSVRSAPERTLRTTAPTVVLAGLGTSAAALAAAPALMPPGYSGVSHTTSESAAQGVDGAWLARTGFVLFGLSVILLATSRRQRWGSWATALHAGFGALLIAVAASVAVPLGMAAQPDVEGELQRLMFVVAYAWYGAEAVRATRDGRPNGSRSRSEAVQVQ